MAMEMPCPECPWLYRVTELEFGDAGVGDLGLLEVDSPQFGQPLEVFQSGVANLSAAETELL